MDLNTRKRKLEAVELDKSDDEDSRSENAAHTPNRDNGSSIHSEDDNLQTFGLKQQYLRSLGIRGPLEKWVHVSNFRCDKSELKEVLELAGYIVMCSVINIRDKYAKVMYSHPLEAVQAVSMLNGQTYYGMKLKVTMIPAPTDTMILPKGLVSIGLGLGINGKPLRDIVVQYRKYLKNESSLVETSLFSFNDDNDDDDEDDVKPEEIIVTKSENRHASSEDLTEQRHPTNKVEGHPVAVENIPIEIVINNRMRQESPDNSDPEITDSRIAKPEQVTESSRHLRPNDVVSTTTDPRLNDNSKPIPLTVMHKKSPPSVPPPRAPRVSKMPQLLETNKITEIIPACGFMPPPERGTRVVADMSKIVGPLCGPPHPFVPLAPLRMTTTNMPNPLGNVRSALANIPCTGQSIALVFSNLPPSTTFPLLCERVAQFGPVVSLQLTAPGCAIVKFSNRASAERCFQFFNGQTIDNHFITVRFL